MKVDFSPVSFKAANSVQDVNNINNQVVNDPFMQALKIDQDHVAKSKNKLELFNYRLHDDNWSKSYDFTTNTLRVKFPNCKDGIEYDVTQDGKVIESNGWTSPVVIVDKHEGLAKYVKDMKDYQLKASGVEITYSNNKKDVAFGSGSSVWDGFTIPSSPAYTASGSNRSVETNMPDVSETSNNSQKINAEPSKVETENVVVSENQEVQQNSQQVNPKQKTTLKEKFANVWKFFTNLGQMTKATLYGIGYGAATAATLLAGSWFFNTLPKAFSKEGPKFSQVFRHPISNISKSGKVIAGIGAAMVFAYHLVVGRLNANQKTAVIDHKLHVGHRDV